MQFWRENGVKPAVQMEASSGHVGQRERGRRQGGAYEGPRAQLASCTLALGRWQETIFRLCPWHPDHRAFISNRQGRVGPTTVGL